MSLMRIRNPNALTPLHVVLLCLTVGTLLGGYLFLSAAETKTLIDGAREWHEESPLRAIVQSLCLNYQFPTIYAGAVKVFLFGLGCGLAVIALSIACSLRVIDDLDVEVATSAGPTRDIETTHATVGDGVPSDKRRTNTASLPLTSAQIVALLYLLWSFASSRWSSAPPLAVGGSILLAVSFLWSYVLGRGLSRRAARLGCVFLVGVTCITAAIAIWYFYGRNPTLRAKFPFGNPNFLAACLIPGILLSGAFVVETVIGTMRRSVEPNKSLAILSILTFALSVWAVALTQSRGPIVGLLVGGAVFVALSFPQRWKTLFITAFIIIMVAGTAYFLSMRNRPENEVRSSTIRFRLYAWQIAWDMFKQKPLHGHGQGGFVLTGDSHVAGYVLKDPEVLATRIAHAHSEGLEILVDLGVLGFVLVVAILVLTIRDGTNILQRGPPASSRWPLVGLISALLALCVEESVSVGLRVSGVPLAFYTVLGLIWAMSQEPQPAPHMFSRTRSRRNIAGTAGCLVGLAIIVMMQQEFFGARHAYQADIAIKEGRVDDAVRFAEMANSRLHPQRTLTDEYRLAEAYMLAARKLQERAQEREARARKGELLDRAVLELAQQDRARSDNDCIKGSEHLGRLIRWSPSFLNHGRVEYWLNVIMAQNAAARQDPNAETLALQNAAVAIKREMRRQPFQPILAVEYLDVAYESLQLDEILLVLARPLRHHDLTTLYVQSLSRIISDPSFDERFEPIVKRAFETAGAIAANGPSAIDDEGWGPEILRIAAVVHFRRGEYDAASHALSVASSAYERLSARAAIGAASCYKELADSKFYGHPIDPMPAIASANRALELTPASMPGRRLRQSILSRLADYHLAAGQENEARTILEEDNSHPEVIDGELGLRYRNLCDILLRRRLARVLRKAPNEMVPTLKSWLRRSLELVPDDPVTHFLSADLAFHTGDFAAAATQLRQALDLGLAPEAAYQFLQVAREKKPDDPNLEAVWRDLTKGQPSPPEFAPGGSPAEKASDQTP